MMEFYLDDVPASGMGMHVEQITPPVKPAGRQKKWTIPGRGGFLLGGDDSLLPYLRYVTAFVPDPNALTAIYAWLHGRHSVRFSTDPGHALECTSVSLLEPEVFVRGVEMTIAFECQPYRYHYPQTDLVLTSPGTIENPGTYPSEPRIAVTATGSFTLSVNGCLMEFTGGSIIIDSKLRDCLSADGASLANDRATLTEFPHISPGANAVSWTGSVSRLDITPRWRDI